MDPCIRIRAAASHSAALYYVKLNMNYDGCAVSLTRRGTMSDDQSRPCILHTPA